MSSWLAIARLLLTCIIHFLGKVFIESLPRNRRCIFAFCLATALRAVIYNIICIVALRDVVGHKSGSLKSESVKYFLQSHGTPTLEWRRWIGPSVILNNRSVLSSEKAPYHKEPATDCNKYLVLSPDGCFISRQTGRLTVGPNVRLDPNRCLL
jgi:hypothetical protein